VKRRSSSNDASRLTQLGISTVAEPVCHHGTLLMGRHLARKLTEVEGPAKLERLHTERRLNPEPRYCGSAFTRISPTLRVYWAGSRCTLAVSA
jgi:hypothetical protein